MSEVKFDPTRYVCIDEYCGILNPYSSSCGRFRIDPYEEYGLTNDDLLYFFKDQEYLDFLKNDYGDAYMGYIEEETEKRGQDYCVCDEHGCKKKKD